jgi:class 3 adenylate cyclase
LSKLPIGTVTFLFTDIEGSTKLWEKHPEEMKSSLARHDSILKESVESNNGQIVKTTGDGIHAVFMYNQDRNEERPSNWSIDRHARTMVSCTASSASEPEPSIR